MTSRCPVIFGVLIGALALSACKGSGGSNSPNLIEQVAGDVEHEINNAGPTAHGAADDVDESARGLVNGNSSSPPPAADVQADGEGEADAEAPEPESTAEPSESAAPTE